MTFEEAKQSINSENFQNWQFYRWKDDTRRGGFAKISHWGNGYKTTTYFQVDENLDFTPATAVFPYKDIEECSEPMFFTGEDKTLYCLGYSDD